MFVILNVVVIVAMIFGALAIASSGPNGADRNDSNERSNHS